MESNPNEQIRAHIWIKGRVQNVGFRAYVEYKALHIGVLGWVRNIGQDTVETVAEGTRIQIDEFIEMVKQGPSASHVDEARIEYEPLTDQLSGFTVKRSM
ncbi:MAG TPA: acylphosphatase [Anaerolineales bacterium]|nr:acylphosphatase [Anaerolineales bacterium]